MTIDKILLTGEELCSAFGCNRTQIDQLERLPDNPLPYIVIDGKGGHLYPVSALHRWTEKELDLQLADREE